MSEVKYKAVPEIDCCKDCFNQGSSLDCVRFCKLMIESGLPDCNAGYIYQLDTSKITLEQAREKFEEWYSKEFPKNCHKDTFQRSKTGNSYAYKMPAESFEAYKQALKDHDILEEGE